MKWWGAVGWWGEANTAEAFQYPTSSRQGRVHNNRHVTTSNTCTLLTHSGDTFLPLNVQDNEQTIVNPLLVGNHQQVFPLWGQKCLKDPSPSLVDESNEEKGGYIVVV